MEKELVLKTIETYNNCAEEYFQINNSIDVIKSHLEFFIKNLYGTKILDVGCGPGRDAKFFSEKGFEVVGIDLSEKLLEIAKENAPNAKFYLMDMRDLNFPDNHFDGLWACASFLHIPRKDAQRTLDGFYKVLKPKGLMYISVKEGTGEKFVKSNRYGKERYFVYYFSRELKKLIEKSGFKVIKEMIEKKKKMDVTWVNMFARK